MRFLTILLRFYFAFRSLIRIFDFVENTSARKKKRKTSFPFAFRSLIRIFVPIMTQHD